MKDITICALFYSHHPELARRCLSSIEEGLETGHNLVHELRLGLNMVSDEVRVYVRDWANCMTQQHGIPSVLFESKENQFKYPMMRRMFFHRPLTSEYVMWFDDDSYLDKPTESWWRALKSAVFGMDMVGQLWLMAVQGNQMEWVKTQPWYDPEVGDVPPKKAGKRKESAFQFCQGAWWVMRSVLLKKYNWPVPEIRHNGGDSMLGELCRQQRLRVGIFHGGVRINADAQGKNSQSKRRGFSENRVGHDYAGTPLDTSFQEFDLKVAVHEAPPPRPPTTIHPYTPEAIHLFGKENED